MALPPGSGIGSLLVWDGSAWKSTPAPSAEALGAAAAPLTLCAGMPVWGTTCTFSPVLKAGTQVAGLLATTGQSKVRLAPLANGSLVVSYTNMTGTNAEGQAWHFVMNAGSMVVAPRQTAPLLDVKAGINLGTNGTTKTRAISFGKGAKALVPLGYSGYSNGTGGYAVTIDGAGTASVFGGTTWYEPSVCAIGSEAFIATVLVDPVAHQVLGYDNAAVANTAVQSLGGWGYNYWGRFDVACGTGAVTGNYAVLARANPNVTPTRIGLTQYGVSANLWSKRGNEVYVPVPTSASPCCINPEIVVADDNGLLVWTGKAADGFYRAYYVRFKLSAAGIQLLDSAPGELPGTIRESVAISAVEAGCPDPSVGCSSGTAFYVVRQSGGEALPGQLANTTQEVNFYRFDFTTGAFTSVATYSDKNINGKVISGAAANNLISAKLGSLVMNCDGNLYYGTSLDGGAGKPVLAVFTARVRVNSTCVK